MSRADRANSRYFDGINLRNKIEWIPIVYMAGERFIIHPNGSIEAWGERHPVGWWGNRQNVTDLIRSYYTAPPRRQKAIAWWDDFGDLRIDDANRLNLVWVREGRPDPLPPELRAIQDAIDEVLPGEEDPDEF